MFPATVTPDAASNPTATPQPRLDVASHAGGTYSVKADAPEYLCASDNKSMMPDMSGATLKAQADNTVILSVGGKDYTLTDMNGYLAYVDTSSGDTLTTITLNDFNANGGNGNFMVMTNDGSKSCIAQLTFTPQ